VVPVADDQVIVGHLDVAVGWHAVAPREFLVSHGLATAGFALPAAVAAHLVHPDRRVVCSPGWRDWRQPRPSSRRRHASGARIVIIVFSESASDVADLTRLAGSFRMTSFGPDSAAQFPRRWVRRSEPRGHR